MESFSSSDDEEPEHIQVAGRGQTSRNSLKIGLRSALPFSRNTTLSELQLLVEKVNCSGTGAMKSFIEAEDYNRQSAESVFHNQLYNQFDLQWAGFRKQDLLSSPSTSKNLNLLESSYPLNVLHQFRGQTICGHVVPENVLAASYNQTRRPNVAFHLPDQIIPSSRANSPTIDQMWGTAKDTLQQPCNTVELSQEDDDMDVAEVFADYVPSKLNIGKKHPDPVVETASLASVQLPELNYTLHLPPNLINSGALSGLQLEAVVYACQQHEYKLPSGERAGFLIGDGAGVGKGRTIAGVILENWIQKRRRALWVSVSPDLKHDSKRDLVDIGAVGKLGINVFALNKQEYGKLTIGDGVLFSTYASLICETAHRTKLNTRLNQIIDWFGEDNDGVIVFDECHRAKNLCPTASTKPTKIGKAVHLLQQMLPNTRVVYASATGASEPKDMAYMVRLGLWGKGTPFPNFRLFMSAVEKRGVGAMEIVAMDMKLRGAYIARQLSFQGVSFSIEEVPLTPEYIRMYDDSVALWVQALQKFTQAIGLMGVESRQRKVIWTQFWSAHQRFFKYLCIAAKVKHACSTARDAVKNGKCVVIGLQSTGEARTLEQLGKNEGKLNDWISSAKGVISSLIEKQFPAPFDKSDEHWEQNASSPIFQKVLEKQVSATGLTTRKRSSSVLGPNFSTDNASSSSSKQKPTGHARRYSTKKIRLADSDDTDSETDIDFDSQMPDLSLQVNRTEASLLGAKHRNLWFKQGEARPDDKKQKNTVNAHVKKNRFANAELALEMKKYIMEMIENTEIKFPPNTLDQLVDELGGPTKVAEMTGRKNRIVQDDQGGLNFKVRGKHEPNNESVNMYEKDQFMSGEKLIAIISEAASCGVSLQSDRRVKNLRRRVHITLELPWSADRAVQQFGRTHRSNQVNAPEYKFLISNLCGEHRFASIVAKRLESLGALTHGDRRATETRDLSKFNIDNKYGRQALELVMKSMMDNKAALTPPPNYEGDFRQDIVRGLIGVGLIVNNDGIARLDKDHANMSKFLNRILGMSVALQNGIFDCFTEILAQIVNNAKRTGRFDLGILDVNDAGTRKIEQKPQRVFKCKHSTGVSNIILHELIVERGLMFTQASHKLLSSDATNNNEGFYLSKQEQKGKRRVALILSESRQESTDIRSALYSIYRPNTGLQVRRESILEVLSKNYKVSPEECEQTWIEQYGAFETSCCHAFWSGQCENLRINQICEVGTRKRTYFVLSGTILVVWNKVEDVFARCSGPNSVLKLQVVRVHSGELRIVGMLVPRQCVDELVKVLRENTWEIDSETD